MKFFKYLFFLIVLVFVAGSLYVATISIPNEKTFSFETPITAELFKQKIEDFSTYENWFSFPEKANTEPRLSNANDFENATLSWQNPTFQAINFRNKVRTQDSLTQQLSLKTWLSSSEIEIRWVFKSTEENFSIEVRLSSDANFWQKTEYALTGTTHMEITQKAIEESLKTLEQILIKETSVYDITPVGKLETGGFYILHATSAARLDFKKILDKSEPIFQSVEDFMKEQVIDIYKGRLIVFENLYEETNNNVIFSAGVGTRNRVVIPDYFEVLSKPIKRSLYFKTQLTGDYINLKELLSIAKSTVEQRDLIINGFLKPYLEFEVDKTDTVNPAEWITNFYIPIIEN